MGTDQSVLDPMPQARQASVRTLPAEEKRRHIFDAAREVIMRRGYDAATMEEISTQAGVGKGTLYNFFSSKEDLFFSLVMDGFERIRELVEAEVAPIEDPWERFEVGWRTLMLGIFPQFNAQWAFIYQLWGFLARDAVARDRMFHAWRGLYQNREQRIVDAITEGQQTGRFESTIRPSSVALLLMATFDGLLHRAMFDPDRVDPEQVLNDILQVVRSSLQLDSVTASTKPGDGNRSNKTGRAASRTRNSRRRSVNQSGKHGARVQPRKTGN